MTIREVMRLVPFRRLWIAQIVSVFGDFLAIFAVLSYVSFNLHATAAQVTGISVSFMIPFALIGLTIAIKLWHDLPEATKRYNQSVKDKDVPLTL